MKHLMGIAMVMSFFFINQVVNSSPVIVIENPVIILRGHEDSVTSISFSPNGQYLASAGFYDQTVRIWDVATGQQITVLREHTEPVFSVTYSPDGKYLVSGSGDKTIKKWFVGWRQDISKSIATLTGHKADILSLAFSPDGNLLASSGCHDNTIRIWEFDTERLLYVLGKEVEEKDRNLELWCGPITFLPDGRNVVSGHSDGTVKIWNIAFGTYVSLFGHNDAVYAVAASADGRLIASGSRDGIVRIWARNKFISEINIHGGPVFALAFSPDSQLLAIGRAFSVVQICNANTGEEIAELHGHTAAVYSLAFNPNGNILASGATVKDQTIRLWDIKALSSNTGRSAQRSLRWSYIRRR